MSIEGRLVVAIVLAGAIACDQIRARPQPAVDAAPAARLTAPVASSMVPAPLSSMLGRPVVPCPVADHGDLDGALDQAAARFDAQDFATALACAELAARIAPRSVEAHHNRAAALVAEGRIEEARQVFALALALDPDDPQTLEGAADLYINRLAPDREQTEIGLEYARRGSAHMGRRRPDHDLVARLALLEAEALDDAGRADEALPRVDSALAVRPDDVEFLYQRAVVLFHLCQLDKARLGFEEVLRRSPDDPYPHHHLGLLLEREGRLLDAEVHFRRAEQLAPDKFPPPVLLSPPEFQSVVDAAVAELGPEMRGRLAHVAIEVGDLPALGDLTAVSPPFAPTILGLYRGAPLGAPSNVDVEPRSIVLYRRNLARAVATRAELEKQVRITLWHELGHAVGEDEDELRLRGLE